ncbi:HAD family hydrolase [Olsenella sp. YH-ols2217]|uniref:HAD family hydrolase n=1 Tax=Kribbibacterium absianum TaxID=3044210 RepID=A0ABT6ZKA7_9ACTN|nr:MULTISPECIES: HAD family hydrolase [unclassified Olsenella]MDJ1122648.1 HAD family hydrolase [Olsenella sp. YH-ols2216]MDJ1129086.1 HAD family hydrolase [Olsenella sp. YH-ols2217]
MGNPEASTQVEPSLPTLNEPRRLVKIAVFDYDGTLINTQSGSQFTRYLLARGIISPWNTAKVVWWGARYVLHLPHDQAAVRRYLVDDLGHFSREEILQIMTDFHDQVLTRYYRPSGLRQIERCREEGCVCVLVSATFWGIARRACEYAGLDAFLATKMACDANGSFTGNVEGAVMEGPEKPKALAAWADATYGPGNWVVEYAFGDHHSDEELLECARCPSAVNPGRTMRSIAKRRGWPILEWR